MTKFYTFNQNNSGGGFHTDTARGIGHYVIVEANSAGEANQRAEEIGLYFNGCVDGTDCPCCGDRWHAQWDESDAEDVPTIWGTSVEEVEMATPNGTFGDVAFIHYKDKPFSPALVP